MIQLLAFYFLHSALCLKSILIFFFLLLLLLLLLLYCIIIPLLVLQHNPTYRPVFASTKCLFFQKFPFIPGFPQSPVSSNYSDYQENFKLQSSRSNKHWPYEVSTSQRFRHLCSERLTVSRTDSAPCSLPKEFAFVCTVRSDEEHSSVTNQVTFRHGDKR
jgi:hypothetical protein